MASASGICVSQQIQRIGANFGSFVLKNAAQTVMSFGVQSSIYKTENAATDLNAGQFLILSFLHGLFNEDLMLCTFLIQMSGWVEQLKSTYLRVWLRDDYVFKREDIEKGLKTFERLVPQMNLEVPEVLVTVLSALAEKYLINDFLPTSGTVEPQHLEVDRNSLNATMCRAVLNNSAAEIITAAARGGDVNLKTDSGDSLYHLAASYDCVESIVTLGYLKANVEARDAEWATPIQRAVMSNNSNVVMALLGTGADFKRRMKGGDTLVHIAITIGCNKALETLLNSGADINVENHKGDIPIILAVKKSNGVAIQLLLDKGADPNVMLKNGDSLLHLACSLKNGDIVKQLIKAGAKTDAKNKAGLLPIHICHERNVIEVLVSNGASVDDKSTSGDTALHLRTLEGDLDSVESLIMLGAYVDIKNNEGETPLILSVDSTRVQERDLQLKSIVQLLLAEGADPNTRDNAGFNAVHRAAKCGSLGVLQTLEANGGDLRVTANNDVNILHMAALNGHSDIVSWLLSSDFGDLLSFSCKFESWSYKYNNVTDPLCNTIKGPFIWTALHLSCFKGNLPVVQTLLTSSSPHVKDNCNFTPLHLAAYSGNVSVVKELLDHNYEVSAKSSQNLTACHIAANQGHLEILKLLIENGANVDEKGYNGWTSLHIAAARGHLEIVKFLSNHGANINSKTCDNYTPSMLSNHYGQTDITNFLNSKGGTT